MPTQITEIFDEEREKRMLRVAGNLTVEDAKLLEKIALEIREKYDGNLTIDLADIDFLDSESAPILQRMSKILGFEFEGIEIFLQTAVDQAEKQNS